LLDHVTGGAAVVEADAVRADADVPEMTLPTTSEFTVARFISMPSSLFPSPTRPVRSVPM
jgi:hypothetical protein